MDVAVCCPVRNYHGSCLRNRINSPDFLRLLPDYGRTAAVADCDPRISKRAGTRGGCLPVSGYASIAAYHKRCSHVACGSADRYQVLAEAVRGMTKYSWSGDTIAAVLMSFSSFGYYGQIWFNRAYTYECAVEEMPAGYGDTLMSVSPAWTFPVVVIIGIIMSVLISNVFMKKQKTIEKSRS